MAIRLIIGNRKLRVKGASISVIRELEKVTSYYVEGFYHAPSFKAKRWDGKEHLLKFNPTKGYTAPIGLLGDICRKLKELGRRYSVLSKRKTYGPKIQYDWNSSITLRPYQNSGVDAVCGDDIWNRGSGLLRMPVRSGKTKTMAGIIHRMGRRALIIVPSQLLLYQTVDSLKESLNREIGMLGDSVWHVLDVTVAMVQTLSKHAGSTKKVGRKVTTTPPTEKYKEIAKFFDLVIFDECHHLVGDVWHNMFMGLDCRYRIGLSATIQLHDKRENERGVIWLKAACGDIRYEIETSELIEQGYLMRQRVELVMFSEPAGYEDWGWSKELNDVLIYENNKRNRKIVKIAIEKVKQNLKVLIISNRLNQLAKLHKILVKKNVGHAVVTGADGSKARKEKIKAFLDNEVDILMGTVFGEGVDIPEIECVINAEGGRDVKATIQRMRNMTPSAGKTQAVFVDIMDLTSHYFAKHSKERLAVYRSEPAFELKVVK